MSSAALTFYMAHFESSITSAQLIAKITTVIPEITSTDGNIFDIDVPKSKMQPLFQFKNVGGVIKSESTSASDLLTNAATLFKFDNSSFPVGSSAGKFDFSTATINGTDSSSAYSSTGIRAGLLFARYIALKLTTSANNVTQFNDLNSIRTGINTKINEAIDLKFNTLTTAGEKGIVNESNPDTTLTNPTYRLMTQIDNKGKMDSRFSDALLLSAVETFQPVPLLVGDKIVFKMTFTPATGQHSISPALPSTVGTPSEIPAIDSIIRITVTDA